ncbi:heat- and acid-stable phosphoprotein [Nowakowskiella sp. JEL0078]|nr:heat- and acid-stable phosphoprotein [Nowakowskiella sp. JEL0078]
MGRGGGKLNKRGGRGGHSTTRKIRPDFVIESENDPFSIPEGLEEGNKEDNGSDSESSDDGDNVLGTEKKKPAVVEESDNPNRVAQRNLKASELDGGGGGNSGQLSRREREEIEKERAKNAFWKAQMEGKTDQAKADLARLAVIKKQREDAARKRADEEAAKNAVKSSKLSAQKSTISKALGPK